MFCYALIIYNPQPTTDNDFVTRHLVTTVYTYRNHISFRRSRMSITDFNPYTVLFVFGCQNEWWD
jgi:hypothetical protein